MNIALMLIKLIDFYIVILLCRVVLSWVISPHQLYQMPFKIIYDLTEPVMAPLRNVIPPLDLGGMRLDLSLMLLFVILEMVLKPLLMAIF